MYVCQRARAHVDMPVCVLPCWHACVRCNVLCGWAAASGATAKDVSHGKRSCACHLANMADPYEPPHNSFYPASTPICDHVMLCSQHARQRRNPRQRPHRHPDVPPRQAPPAQRCQHAAHARQQPPAHARLGARLAPGAEPVTKAPLACTLQPALAAAAAAVAAAAAAAAASRTLVGCGGGRRLGRGGGGRREGCGHCFPADRHLRLQGHLCGRVPVRTHRGCREAADGFWSAFCAVRVVQVAVQLVQVAV